MENVENKQAQVTLKHDDNTHLKTQVIMLNYSCIHLNWIK